MTRSCPFCLPLRLSVGRHLGEGLPAPQPVSPRSRPTAGSQDGSPEVRSFCYMRAARSPGTMQPPEKGLRLHPAFHQAGKQAGMETCTHPSICACREAHANRTASSTVIVSFILQGSRTQKVTRTMPFRGVTYGHSPLLSTVCPVCASRTHRQQTRQHPALCLRRGGRRGRGRFALRRLQPPLGPSSCQRKLSEPPTNFKHPPSPHKFSRTLSAVSGMVRPQAGWGQWIVLSGTEFGVRGTWVQIPGDSAPQTRNKNSSWGAGSKAVVWMWLGWHWPSTRDTLVIN